MEEKALRILEFDKICDRLAEQAVLSLTQEDCKNLRPETDIEKVRVLLSETDEAVALLLRRSNPPLSSLKDVSASMKRTEVGATLSMKELRNIAHLLRVARLLKKYPDEEKFEERAEHLAPYFNALFPIPDLEKKIDHIILSDEEIADDASPTLLNLRRKALQLHNKIKDILNDMIRSQKYQNCLQDALITMRGDRYVLPVKAERKGEMPGIVHDTSSSGATLFIEPAIIVEINNEIQRIAAEERDEIERILMELSGEAAEYARAIKENFRLIRKIDFIFAKAKFAVKIDGRMPQTNNEGIIEIKNGRHPLLNKRTIVPINIYLGEEFDTLVITGPNTGGKTVALKTLGLFTLMTQAGLLIPADSGSRMAVFRKVFADIGDEQSIEQSLSTFSAHMVNIVHILENADDSSLVLFDELGAGTDPTEGAALAVSILEYVKSCGAKTAATTHYSEIKIYALTTERAVNAACEFDVETLSPTYKLLIGVPGKSNAFAISKKLGLSDHIINRAKEVISTESVKMEDVIATLEENRQRAQAEKELAEKERLSAESLRKQSAAEQRKISEKRDKFLEDARREAKEIVEEARREMDEMLKEARQAMKEREFSDMQAALDEYRRRAGKKKNELDEALTKSTLSQKRKGGISAKKIHLGDTVEVTTLGQTGSVLTLPDNSGNLQVQVGILKVTTNLRDLAAVQTASGKEIAKKFVQERVSRVGVSMVKREIHVRGLMVEEAIFEVDKFLDDAVMANLETVNIVHGKGTGALRAGLHKFLKGHPHVAEFRLGRYGEGEDGVTIVTLK